MNWSYLFLQFDGRIGRKPYWIASSLLIAASFLSWFLTYSLGDGRLRGIIDLAILYPDFAVLIKRAHDRDMSNQVPILYLVLSVALNFIAVAGLDGPINDPSALYWALAIPNLAVSLYLMITLGLFRGTRGPNRYGPDTLERQR